ncbi:MAG TPA: dienelactone hydrolase family protein [Anaerolineales bacterium]|nr:dienelactone hydrolase family protein [Anaerolineales bacterium]
MNRFQTYLVEEFAEDYQEGHLSRREALKLIAGVTGSLLLANSILAGCTPPGETTTTSAPSLTATTEPPATPVPSTSTDTPAGQPETAAPETSSPGNLEIEAADVQFQGEGATLLGYLARPGGEGSIPVVLVCHENRGLTEHIKDVTRRLARAGYAALAVDLLSRQGGTAALSSDQVPGALGSTDPEQFVQDFRSGLSYLQEQPFVQAERVGMVGFCFGGGVTWLAATRLPELRAAAPFYGPHPPVEEVPNIQAAVLAIYAGNDQRINQGIPAIEEAMQQNDKVYEKVIYPNTDHAFHNDTGPRYNPEAAQDAWSRTLDWFERYLRS